MRRLVFILLTCASIAEAQPKHVSPIVVDKQPPITYGCPAGYWPYVLTHPRDDVSGKGKWEISGSATWQESPTRPEIHACFEKGTKAEDIQ